MLWYISLSLKLSWVEVGDFFFLRNGTCMTAAEVELLLWGNLIFPLRLLASFPNRFHCFCCFCYSVLMRLSSPPLWCLLFSAECKWPAVNQGIPFYPVLLPPKSFPISNWALKTILISIVLPPPSYCTLLSCPLWEKPVLKRVAVILSLTPVKVKVSVCSLS